MEHGVERFQASERSSFDVLALKIFVYKRKAFLIRNKRKNIVPSPNHPNENIYLCYQNSILFLKIIFIICVGDLRVLWHLPKSDIFEAMYFEEKY